jgi:non-specific protein-tyrosine kinase
VDLRQLVRALRKRWRLVVIALAVSLGAGVGYVVSQVPRYQAQAQLFVAAREQAPNGPDAYAGDQFTQSRIRSYLNLVSSQPVLQAVIDQLGVRYTWGQLAREVSASSPPGTVLININVVDRSASLARDLANAISQRFTQNVSGLETVDPNIGPPVRISVSQPAGLPRAPVVPQTTRDLAVALLVGLAVGVAAAVARESLDTGVKSAQELGEVAQTTVLGVIPRDRDARRHPLLVNPDRPSRRDEAFRQLRTNLQFIDTDRPLRSFVVTSCLPGEGKTVTACNLAILFAQTGMNVILAEADLRRPQVAKYMGLENTVGLTSVLLGSASLDEALQPWEVEGGRLWLLAAGPTLPNPSEVLGSTQAGQTFDQLERAADIVVVDAPPILPVADAAILSTLAQATVLLTRYGKTRREQIAQAVEALGTVEGRLAGAVLNAAPLHGPDAVRYYEYAYPYGRNRGRITGPIPTWQRDGVSSILRNAESPAKPNGTAPMPPTWAPTEPQTGEGSLQSGRSPR